MDGDALHVARVSVALQRRGRGVARSLIAACENEARERGIRRMTLKTRLELPENERLFERCGFARREVEAHAGFEGPTTAVMEKVLA
jgi:GNAT superfamily N-acetyltransferase